jgi:hypothetical protein
MLKSADTTLSSTDVVKTNVLWRVYGVVDAGSEVRSGMSTYMILPHQGGRKTR